MVDPELRIVEVWDFAAGATEPRIVRPGEPLAWTPEDAEVALEIDLEDLLDRP